MTVKITMDIYIYANKTKKIQYLKLVESRNKYSINFNNNVLNYLIIIIAKHSKNYFNLGNVII